jgi:hypothetical protein
MERRRYFVGIDKWGEKMTAQLNVELGTAADRATVAQCCRRFGLKQGREVDEAEYKRELRGLLSRKDA